MLQKVKQIGFTLSIVICSFLITLTVVAWTGPTQAPPNGNVSPPIDQSTTSQYKQGALGIGGVFETDMDTHLAITGGNVGIGTSSPGDLLHIYDNYNGGVHVQISNGNTGTSSYAGLLLDGEGNNFFLKNWGDGSSSPNLTEFISTAGNSEFTFSPSSSEAMRIDSGGNVSISRGNLDMNNNKISNTSNLQYVVLWSDGSAGNSSTTTGNDLCVARGYSNCRWEIRFDTNELRSCDEQWECRNSEGTMSNCRAVICNY